MENTDKKSAFEAITTQEALDRIVESRLARERAKYPHYDDYKAKAEKLDEAEEKLNTTRQELNAALGEVEEMRKANELTELKTTIGKEAGVPAEMLRGDSKDALEAHAKQIKDWVASQKVAPVVPTQGAEPQGEMSPALKTVRRLFGTNDS